jgi:hypothetical protein
MTLEALIDLLENFRQNERKVKVLQFELANPPQLTSSELIEAMALSAPEQVEGMTGHISDKTMRIALNHENLAAEMMVETRDTILKELVPLKVQQDKLKYFISLLGNEGRILVGYYVDGKSWNQLEQETEVTIRTLHRWKNEQVKKLFNLYLFSEQHSKS